MQNLVEKAKEGDQTSFISLVESVRKKAYNTAYMQLGNREDASDAVQETILKTYERIGTLRDGRYFSTWFIRILLNECHNIHRSRKKLISLAKRQKTYAEPNIEDTGKAVEMEELISRLGSIYKIVIDLRYNHDLKISQIAKVLDIPEGTVKSRLNKALGMLKKEFDVKEEAK